MLLVIFGAGASYDSYGSLPPGLRAHEHRPPLADELFADRDAYSVVASRFPTCLPIIDPLRNRPKGVSVEQRLEEFNSQADGDSQRHRQLAAIRFYLQLMLWECVQRWNDVTRGVTNYATLLDQIRHFSKGEQPCLVTFNYDTLLDRALGTIGKPLKSISAYISGDDWKFIKIHGSVNWGRELDDPVDVGGRHPEAVAQELIEQAPNLKISQRYRMITSNVASGLVRETALFPALAIPVETKRHHECPDEHLQALRACLPRVTRLLLIGWRASEIPFLDLLKKNVQREVSLTVVASGKNTALKVLDKMRKTVPHREVEAFDGGFTDFIRQQKVDAFLRS